MPPLGFSKGGHKFFKGGGQCPPLGGAVKYPDKICMYHVQNESSTVFQLYIFIHTAGI